MRTRGNRMREKSEEELCGEVTKAGTGKKDIRKDEIRENRKNYSQHKIIRRGMLWEGNVQKQIKGGQRKDERKYEKRNVKDERKERKEIKDWKYTEIKIKT